MTDHWQSFTETMILHQRRSEYYEQIQELKSQGDSITDTDLLKLLLLTKTVIWYDEHIQQRENQG